MRQTFSQCGVLILLTISLFLLPVAAHAQSDFAQRFQVLAPQDKTLASTRIDSVAISSQSVVAWGTKMGLYLEQPNGTGRWFNSSNAPFNLEMIPCSAFYNGDLWTTVRNPAVGQGLFKFDGTNWRKFLPTTDYMLSTQVNCMLVDGKNRLWIGYQERGIDQYVGVYFKKKSLMQFEAVKAKHGLLAGSVLSMADVDGQLWVGTSVGLSRFLPPDFKSHVDELHFRNWTYPDFPGHVVNAVVPFGGKVAAATERGIVIPNDDNWRLIGVKEGLAIIPVRAIANDGVRLWFCTPAGIQMYENGKVSPLFFDLPSREINCLAAVGTPGGGAKIFVGTDKGARLLIYK